MTEEDTRPVHMTVITPIGPELKCGKERVPGVRLTDRTEDVTCSECQKG